MTQNDKKLTNCAFSEHIVQLKRMTKAKVDHSILDLHNINESLSL